MTEDYLLPPRIKKSPVLAVANTILGSEKAVGLQETILQSPNYEGFHRYQIIQVIRDDYIAEWRKDMGLAKNFKGVKLLRIPSFMVHTVDELMDLADELRAQSKEDIKDLMEWDAMRGITEAWHEELYNRI